MLWTIYPEEAVMANSDKIPALQEYQYGGKHILGYATAQGSVCIAALLSSDPKDFLDPKLQPGTVIPCRKL